MMCAQPLAAVGSPKWVLSASVCAHLLTPGRGLPEEMKKMSPVTALEAS